MARVMLNQFSLPKYFWAEAVNTACYVLNRVLIRPESKKTPYELWFNRTPYVSYFKIFGCKYFIFNAKDNLGKFDSEADEGIFLGYATKCKSYRVFNKKSMSIEESIKVTFDEMNNETNNDSDDQDHGTPSKAPIEAEPATTYLESLPKKMKFMAGHSKDLVICEIQQGVSTRSSTRDIVSSVAFISQLEPKNIEEVCSDIYWLDAMQENLNQFERNQVWELVPNLIDHLVIGT